MRKMMINGIWVMALLLAYNTGHTQSMHFSQYYNAPLLLNPANTALTPEYDYRVGGNYRNQWSALPVPFNTIDGFFDLKIGGNNDNEKANWLGLGGAIFNDKAGNGDLSLTQLQGSLAYHLHLGYKTMLSFGGSAAYVQRSVNFDKLTWDNQWDGFNFSTYLPNGERKGLLKTNYSTIALGANLAYFPNEAVYIKVGVAASNINQPTETFYNGGTNQVKMRGTGNVDVLVRTSADFIINPSLYYTAQNGAAEITVGSLARYNMSKARDAQASQLILGAFVRLNDALIGVAGYQFGGLTFTASYDFTMSTLAPYNSSYGALEFSVIYGSEYYKNKGSRKMYSCPRFN